MTSNIERFKKDLDELIARGRKLELSMQRESTGESFDGEFLKALGEKGKDILKALPSFTGTYQSWYSESMAVIRQLLPHRLADFTRHYEKPKGRKDISFENYHIEDYLQGLRVTRGPYKEVIVDSSAAIPRFQQQLAILESVKGRFESSLFDIRQLVQADLFDSEIDAARELAKAKFGRAAGAMAGVVLEKHLAQVCDNHRVNNAKKNPTIGDLNNALKDANVIDTAQWRFIQHLADLRNLCDHNKKAEPTATQVDDLVEGVDKTIKTLF